MRLEHASWLFTVARSVLLRTSLWVVTGYELTSPLRQEERTLALLPMISFLLRLVPEPR